MPTVHAVHRLTPTIVEVVVHAPAQARAFRPGQFYRLQNYEMLAPRVSRGRRGEHGAGDGRPRDDRRLDRSGARAGVGDRAGDGRLVRSLRAAEAGRAGGADGADRDRRPRSSPSATVALVGGGLGNAVLFSIGAATARGRIAGDLLRRLQADARSLQGGGDRARRRCRSSGAATRRRVRADAAAGPQLRRQHRAGDGGVRAGRQVAAMPLARPIV